MATTGPREIGESGHNCSLVMTPLRRLCLLVVLALTMAACSTDSDPIERATPEEQAEAVDSSDDAAAEVATTEAPETTTTTELPETTTVPPDEPLTASASGEATFGEEFPDIIGVEAVQEASGAWRFAVTVSSPYDTPQRYADAWRVVDPDGNELGIRVLLHDHANEQPFTRSQNGIEIPDGITEVTVQGRDLANGWGGAELVVAIPN